MNGKAPRTASQALANGGDCTEFAYITVALLKEAKVPSGAMIVHFDSAPPKMKHMVPYAKLDDKKVIIDLQAGKLGETGKGKYTVEKELTLDEAAMMYYREMGDYHIGKKEWAEAAKALEKAVSIYDKDAYSNYNLAVCYQQTGDMDNANKHMKKAAELDPKYSASKARGSYNAEIQAADAALQSGDFAGCVAHYQNALDSGEKLTAQDKAIIDENVAECQSHIPASK